MTQQQRADVWLRKNELTNALNQVPDKPENKAIRQQLMEAIETCNTELTTNTYKPPIANAD